MINMKIDDKSLVLINKRTNLNFSNFTMPPLHLPMPVCHRPEGASGKC